MRNVVKVDLLNLFNLTSLILFVILVTLAAFRMGYRLYEFTKYGFPIPSLLKRDILVFSALGTYFGTALIALLLGIQGLGREWLWVVPRGVMVLASMIYWVWVEYHLEDATTRTKR